MNGRKPSINSSAADLKRSKSEIEGRRTTVAALAFSGHLVCPSELSEEAKKKWRHLMRLYSKMSVKILSALDAESLSAYCESWSVWKEARDEWKFHGCKIIGADKEEQHDIDKAIRTMNNQAVLMSRFAEQLCLSPVGRARMGMNPADRSGSAMDEFLAMRMKGSKK